MLIEEINNRENINLPKPNFKEFPQILTYLDELQRKYPNFIYYGNNTRIKEYVVIEGFVIACDNVEILPFTHIRGPLIINSNSKIKGEIKRSYIGKHTNSVHMSNYIGDSIVGDNCNFGAGTITANLRFDNEEIYLRHQNQKIQTHSRKFGCVVENDVKTGANTVIMPGSYIK